MSACLQTTIEWRVHAIPVHTHVCLQTTIEWRVHAMPVDTHVCLPAESTRAHVLTLFLGHLS